MDALIAYLQSLRVPVPAAAPRSADAQRPAGVSL
jgi:hypothetical protein